MPGVDDDERGRPGVSLRIGAALCAREWRGRGCISAGVVLWARGEAGTCLLPRRASRAGSFSMASCVVARGGRAAEGRGRDDEAIEADEREDDSDVRDELLDIRDAADDFGGGADMRDDATDDGDGIGTIEADSDGRCRMVPFAGTTVDDPVDELPDSADMVDPELLTLELSLLAFILR